MSMLTLSRQPLLTAPPVGIAEDEVQVSTLSTCKEENGTTATTVIHQFPTQVDAGLPESDRSSKSMQVAQPSTTEPPYSETSSVLLSEGAGNPLTPPVARDPTQSQSNWHMPTPDP